VKAKTLKPCSDCGKQSIIWKSYGKAKCCQACSKKREPPKKIPKESARRKKERPIYTKNKNQALEERPYCELRIPGVCTGWAQGMQHKKGRAGSLYLDLKHQATSCNKCNLWCVEHPIEAVELGAAEFRNRI